MKITVKDIKGNDREEVEVRFPVIENGKGSQALHDVVVAHQAAQRSGTASTKTMGEVAGTGKKPWRQKGTGRARAGSFASPLWRGGGVVFGPKPRDHRKKVTRNTRQLALRKALSERLAAGEVTLVDDIKLESHKTREFLGVLSALQVDGSATLVVARVEKNLALASRNVTRVRVATSDSVNAYQLLLGKRLLLTRAAFQQLEQRLSKN